jgi:hypothetical protein
MKFKEWFKLMWKNNYIQVFVLAFIFLIIEIVKIDVIINSLLEIETTDRIFVIPFLFIPIAVLVVTAYKGFYQFWNDYKSGNSR